MSFFEYDWNAPFRSASAARRPAPAQRLSYEELLASLQDRFQPPPRPEPAQSLQDLDPEARRQVRQQSIFSALADLGASMQTGDFRYAGAGAGRIAEIERTGLADANARAEGVWQRQQEDAARMYQQEERQREVAALHGMYEEVIEGEDPTGPWADKAAMAARAGSMSELAQMREARGKRAFIRSKGMDPDLFGDNERAEAELKAEIERANAAASEAQELARLEKEEEIRREAKLAEEEALREQGLGSYAPPQLPPLSRIEAEERIRAKFREPSGGPAGQRIMEANGVPGLVRIDPTTGGLTFSPATGVPEKPGEVRVFTNEDGEQAPYRLDPSGVWYPMKVGQAGSAPPPRAPAGPGRQPAENRAPQANHWRNLAADALAKGGTEEEALRRLRAIGPQNGFTPEQILENAKAMARKRGWNG